MKKIGLLSLALVLALGTLGIGYAAWTDTLYVEGEVNTGKVDLVIEDLSGVWVYKVPPHGIEWLHGWGTTSDPIVSPTPGAELIASATAEMDPDDPDGDTVIVTFDNLFPCEWFMVDFLIHYEGIPAILVGEISTDDDWLQGLWDIQEAGVMAFKWDPEEPDPHAAMGDPVNLCDPFQVHNCEWYKVILFIHIPQEDIYMNLTGSFTATVTAVQWNEYPL